MSCSSISITPTEDQRSISVVGDNATLLKIQKKVHNRQKVLPRFEHTVTAHHHQLYQHSVVFLQPILICVFLNSVLNCGPQCHNLLGGCLAPLPMCLANLCNDIEVGASMGEELKSDLMSLQAEFSVIEIT
ncbi:hypothetical protein CEXT_159761 [Caerostris extrusa]|uniref:Uncharacterized protein n=1 Tax=Caerostris extrusa TaxID=172846 RepID=A0AAV4TJ83_CAEEX|nr:hypothetical protein CEXT_159761 [Caerostris extrusa]